eukprot:993736_1
MSFNDQKKPRVSQRELRKRQRARKSLGTSRATAESSKENAHPARPPLQRRSSSAFRSADRVPFKRVRLNDSDENIERFLKRAKANDKDESCALSRKISEIMSPINVVPSEVSNQMANQSLMKRKIPIPEIQTKNPPFDWCLKRRIRLTSPHSFAEFLPPRPTSECQGTEWFLRDENVDYQAADLDKSAAFFNARLCWVYPATYSERSNPEFEQAEWEKWQDAFRSAYYSFRSGRLGFFYLRISDTCMCLFLRIPEICVVMCGATPGIRRTLRGEDCEFETPLIESDSGLPENVKFPSDEIEELEEYYEYQKDVGRKSKLPTGQSHRKNVSSVRHSLLKFKGRARVHSLYDWLLNTRRVAKSGPRQTSSVRDRHVVPEILTDRAFVHATLRPLRIARSVSTCQIDGKSMVHTVEMDGAILPSSVAKMCNLLKSNLKGQFTLELYPDESCTGLGAVSLVDAKLEANCVSLDEILADHKISTQDKANGFSRLRYDKRLFH